MRSAHPLAAQHGYKKKKKEDPFIQIYPHTAGSELPTSHDETNPR